MGFFDKLKQTFSKTSEAIKIAITGKKIDEDFYQDLEDALIKADVGAQTAISLARKVADKKFPRETTEGEIKAFLAAEITSLVRPYESDQLFKIQHDPEIILVIGVNGNGKTTTIAKIANILVKEGHKPLLIAGDTFRAAAVAQLQYWGERLGVEVHSGKENSDAAGLIFSGIERAKREGYDVVLADTAGRMQNREDLLAELEKIKRSINKADNTAPHKTVLVIDGLMGQAVHSQLEVFVNKVGVDGLVVTKLDSGAKGGTIISLTQKYHRPIFAIGTGEGIEDLQKFSAEAYASAILGIEHTN